MKQEAFQKYIHAIHSELSDDAQKTYTLSMLETYFGSNKELDTFASHPCYLADLYLTHMSMLGKLTTMPLITARSIRSPIDDTRLYVQYMIVFNDMPFIVETAKMCLRRMGYDIISCYNSLHLKSGEKLSLVCLTVNENASSIQSDVIDTLRDYLNDASAAVADWNPMRDQMDQAVSSWRFARSKGFMSAAVHATHVEFFQWLRTYFTFLGSRSYILGSNGLLEYRDKSGLGVTSDTPKERSRPLLLGIPRQINDGKVSLFYISKTKTYSTVHRPTITDLIGLRVIGPSGEVIGELRIIGLFSRDAFECDPTKTPLLSQKLEGIKKILDLKSRYTKKLFAHIIKNYPREELFQASIEEMSEAVREIISLYDQPREYVIARRDSFDHYYSCLVYVPREKYNTYVKQRIEAELLDYFDGTQATNQPFFDESVLVRVHFVIQIDPTARPQGSIDCLRDNIQRICRSWTEQWQSALYRTYNFYVAQKFLSYCGLFDGGYTSVFSPEDSVKDIQKIDNLRTSGQTTVSVSFSASLEHMTMCVYELNDRKIFLTHVLNAFGLMGLDGQHQQTCEIHCSEGVIIVSRYLFKSQEDFYSTDIDVGTLEDKILAIITGKNDIDQLNGLIFSCAMSLDHIRLLRCYSAYLKQLKFDIGRNIVNRVLSRNHEISQELVSYFESRFNPLSSTSKAESHIKLISSKLSLIKSIDDDKVIQAIMCLMQQTVRTNYFVPDATTIALKIHGSQVPFMPVPRSLYEIFVYSEEFESIHIRNGRLARGGIRWSNRDDYRAEVVMLAKAQTVKNSLIVPTGAKGGFYLKKNSVDLLTDGIRAYQLMISSMLAITDNRTSKGVVRSKYVNVYDTDDDYLVVAADKGTARFSDVANEISIQNNFWLRDAFASGGKHGYDHKAMGITAKGAWRSLEWYFYSKGMTPNKPFRVVGIGDMSGDVFGNGMLLSNQIKLVAAFNHEHIFLDPDPDVGISFEERKRLFSLPQSKWTDYKGDCLSEGGGVYRRSEKLIKISHQSMRSLGITKSTMTPDELIVAVLCAPVEVLWNGGIGTYVKASDQTDHDVDDFVNKNCRIDAKSLKASMVIEGGNLGLTQRARVEYALSGGMVNTDFIDNSAGVDCSDHEVNIKILLEPDICNDHLSMKDRNTLLESMMATVEKRVLCHNTDQNICITLASESLIDNSYISKSDRLNRWMKRMCETASTNLLENDLPDKHELKMRTLEHKSLSRPELAILLSYTKTNIKKEIEAITITQDQKLDLLLQYFPRELSGSSHEKIMSHPLANSISALMLSHEMVTHTGIFFPYQFMELHQISMTDAIKAYMRLRGFCDLNAIYISIKKLMSLSEYRLSIEYFKRFNKMVEVAISWIVKGEKRLLDSDYQRFIKSTNFMMIPVQEHLSRKYSDQYNRSFDLLQDLGMPSNESRLLSALPYIRYQLNIMTVMFLTNDDLDTILEAYFAISHYMKISWMKTKIAKLRDNSRWETIQRNEIEFDLDDCLLRLVVAYLNHSRGQPGVLKKKMQMWYKRCKTASDNWHSFMDLIYASSNIDLSTFTVTLRRLKQFIACIESHESSPQI